MGVEASIGTDQANSGHYKRMPSEGTPSSLGNDAIERPVKGELDSALGAAREQVFGVIWRQLVKNPLKHLSGVFERKNSPTEEQDKREETSIALTETRLEQLVPSLEEGYYTGEELSSGIKALMTILYTKQQTLDESGVFSTNDLFLEKVIEILEKALIKLSHQVGEDDIIRVIPSSIGFIISKVGSNAPEMSHVELFEIEYDEEIGKIRRSYLLQDPIQVMDGFQGRSPLLHKPEMQQRSQRLQEMVTVLVQRLLQMIDRAAYQHQWGRLEDIGVIEKAKKTPLHPDIAAMFAEKVEDLDGALPFIEGMGNHIGRLRKELREKVSGKRGPSQLNPLLGCLPNPKDEWQQLLNIAYRINTYGSSMLNGLRGESLLLGVIEEHIDEALRRDQAPQLSQVTLRSLLVQKGLAKMREKGWNRYVGITGDKRPEFDEVAYLKSGEQSLLEEYAIGMRLPRSGQAFGLGELFLWKSMSFSIVPEEELEQAFESFPMRQHVGLEPCQEDYLNLLMLKLTEILSRTSGAVVSSWDQLFGVLLEDPALGALMSVRKQKANLWAKNRMVLINILNRSYRDTTSPRNQNRVELIKAALRAAADQDLSEEEGRKLLEACQDVATALQEGRNKQQRADEMAFLSAWEKRFAPINRLSVKEYIEGERAVVGHLQAANILKHYLNQLANSSLTTLRMLLLWDERFSGKLAQTFSFSSAEAGIVRQVKMIEQHNGLVIPVQDQGRWTFIYPYQVTPWQG